MKRYSRVLTAAMTVACCAVVAGCLFRPTTMVTRSFVLTPMAAPEVPEARGSRPVIGIARVNLPNYVKRSTLAVRNGPNEIGYIENAIWAEPLDQGFQRSLAANLAHLLPADQFRLSDWRPGEISLSLHVVVQRFDVDTLGHAELVAWWRIFAPTAGQTSRSGETRLSLEGSPPLADPQAMAATLSALVGELSKVLATAIQESQAPGA